MTENEISSSYKNCFSNCEEIKEYLKETSLELDPKKMAVKILTIPSNIERRLFEVNDNEIATLQSIDISNYNFQDSFLNSHLDPFAHGLRHQIPSSLNPVLEIHRNGCIQYVNHYNDKENGIFFCPKSKIAVKIMQILELTSKILSRYNYFGDVKIIIMLQCENESRIAVNNVGDRSSTINLIDAKINREHPSQYIEKNCSEISSSIMNEICNHYGLVKSNLFDDEGKWKEC